MLHELLTLTTKFDSDVKSHITIGNFVHLHIMVQHIERSVLHLCLNGLLMDALVP